MHDGSRHHAGNGTHSSQQIVSVHDRPRHSKPSRSERRGAPVRAGLRVPHLPRRPSGTTGSREDPHVIAIRLHPEDLVTSGDGLTRREPEHLAAGSPELDLLTVLVPESRHYSLHRDSLLSRKKKTFVTAPQL